MFVKCSTYIRQNVFLYINIDTQIKDNLYIHSDVA
jgi:hypothetical protein